MNFVFEENNKPLGVVDLKRVAAAEIDWGNSYIHVYMIDVAKPASFYFETESQLKYEFVRLTVELEPFDYTKKPVKSRTQPQP